MLEPDDLYQAAAGAPRKSAGGCSGHTLDSLRWLVVDHPETAKLLLEAVQQMADGKVPREIGRAHV